MKEINIRIKIDKDLGRQFKDYCKSVDLDMSKCLRMYIKNLVNHKQTQD